MRIFDTDVQKLKYDILREVARYAYEDRLLDGLTEIPKIIAPGPKPTMRCCIYKERAIVSERLKLAMGGDKDNPNTIEVIGIACDECPVSSYQVTDACRGCLAHRCAAACPRGAISFDEHQKAHIDPDKCVECGRCAGGLPVQRDFQPQASLRKGVQGEGDHRGRKPRGAHRSGQVH